MTLRHYIKNSRIHPNFWIASASFGIPISMVHLAHYLGFIQ